MNKTLFFVANASSIHTVKWVNYFIQEGYNVHLATFSKKNNTACKNIYYLGNKNPHMGGGNYHYLFSVPKLAQIFKKIQPDTINAHYSYSMGLIALLAKKKAKIQSEFSVVCYGSDILSPPLPYIFDITNKYILKNSHKVFVVSDQIKEKLEKFGISMDKVFIGQYGIEKEMLNSEEKDIDIISNRAYTSNSQIDLLLDVLDNIYYKKLKIIFILPGIKESQLLILKRKYPHIIFYDYMEHNTMINLVKRAKIYISATKSDGTSLSLLEAMAFKCIPVVSNIISNRSWILDGINGYLFSSKIELEKKLNIALDREQPNELFKINEQLLLEKGTYLTQMYKIEKFLLGTDI